MHSEDNVAQTLFWENVNNVLAANNVEKVRFKGFMADSPQAKSMAVNRVYGSRDT